MAETVDESAFWLPSEFLTDDFFFMAKETTNFNCDNGEKGFAAPNTLSLPPTNGGFGLFRSPSALNSPGESVVSSTETESNEDQNEFVAELARQLAQSTIREAAGKVHHHEEKSWGALPTSPQSTLCGFASWTTSNDCHGSTLNAPSQARSPRARSAGNGADWDLIYAAAGRVARMRMNSQTQMMNSQSQMMNQAGKGFLGANCNSPSGPFEGRTSPVCYNVSQSNQVQQMKSHVNQGWLCRQQIPSRGGGRVGCGGPFECGKERCGANGTALGLPQSAWMAQQQSNHRLNHSCAGGCGVGSGGGHGSGRRAVFLGGSGSAGIKRQSTGTGVFLPRRVGSNPTPEPRKKQGCSTVLLPARVVHALNLNIEDRNGHTQPCLVPNHDTLLARRNALFAQQRRLRSEGPISHHEVPLLPREWTY